MEKKPKEKSLAYKIFVKDFEIKILAFVLALIVTIIINVH